MHFDSERNEREDRPVVQGREEYSLIKLNFVKLGDQTEVLVKQIEQLIRKIQPVLRPNYETSAKTDEENKKEIPKQSDIARELDHLAYVLTVQCERIADTIDRIEL